MKNAYLGEEQSQWLRKVVLECRGPFVDPTVTFRLIDETGKVLEEILLRQSELTPS